MKINLNNFNNLTQLKLYLNKTYNLNSNDYYFTHNNKYYQQEELNMEYLDVNFKLKGGSTIIGSDDELRIGSDDELRIGSDDELRIGSDDEFRIALYNSNKINLSSQSFNINIDKNIRKDEAFEIIGNNSVINGNVSIKSFGDVHLKNIKILGKLEILLPIFIYLILKIHKLVIYLVLQYL